MSGTTGEMFRIEVVEQRWLTDRETDLCSHGRLSITIGDVTVADGTEEFGISESALGLLRTLDCERCCTSGSEDDRLIMHGCGAILMMGCPIGIGWDVEHRAEGVRVSNVVLCDGTSHGERRLPIDLVVPRTQYVRTVCRSRSPSSSSSVGGRSEFRTSGIDPSTRRSGREFDVTHRSSPSRGRRPRRVRRSA